MAQLATNGGGLHAPTVRVGLLGLAVAALVAVAGLALAQFAWPTGSGAVREFHVSAPPAEAWGTQFVVADGIPIWLVRQPGGELRAFLARNPHPRGCDARYVTSADSDVSYTRWLREARQSAGFYDPCLGSMWLLDGTRIFGPAPRGLDGFDVREDDAGGATIDLRKVLVGACSSGVEYPSAGRYCSTADEPLYQSRGSSRWPF